MTQILQLQKARTAQTTMSSLVSLSRRLPPSTWLTVRATKWRTLTSTTDSSESNGDSNTEDRLSPEVEKKNESSETVIPGKPVEEVEKDDGADVVEMWNKEAPGGPEWGGPRGYEPTRHGDWSQKGRVSDF